MSLVLFDSTVVKDRRTLNKVAKATGLYFHPKFGYSDSSTDEEREASVKLYEMGYCLTYFSGCFCPYLCKLKEK